MGLLGFSAIGVMELILIIIVLLPFVLTLYCIIDIIRADFKDSNSKILFLLLVLLLPFIGSVLYLFLRKNYINSKNSFNQLS